MNKTLYVVARTSGGFAKEDPSVVDIVAALTHEQNAKTLAMIAHGKVHPIEVNHIPLGYLEDAKALGRELVCMDATVVHVGKHAHRLDGDSRSARREKAYAEAWAEMQGKHDGETLAFLLGDDNHTADVTPEQAMQAATLIQWLGTPVGQGFLEKAQAKFKDM